MLNEEVKKEIQNDWNAVIKLLKDIKGYNPIVPGTGIIQIPDAPDTSYNLPLVLAFSVLDEFLTELICPGKIKPLGTKMNMSKSYLSWIDYDKVFKGKEKRNDLAHKAKLLSKEDCIKYIDAIGAELKSWKLINAT